MKERIVKLRKRKAELLQSYADISKTIDLAIKDYAIDTSDFGTNEAMDLLGLCETKYQISKEIEIIKSLIGEEK